MSGTKRKPVHLISRFTKGKPYCGQKGKGLKTTQDGKEATCTSCMRALNYSVEQRRKEAEAQEEFNAMMKELEQEYLERKAKREAEAQEEVFRNHIAVE